MELFVISIHSISCILLVIVILMQSGRGGGLTEAFASAESMFGAKTNAFMVKVTTVAAVVFFATSLSLAFLSSKKSESLMPTVVATDEAVINIDPALSVESEGAPATELKVEPPAAVPDSAE